MTYFIKDITDYLENIAPLGSQENYDNSGLIVGKPTTKVKGVLLSLDCIEKTVDEAKALGANLIITHHPIIFSGLKRLNGTNYVERTVEKAIKNDIAIYAIHTNLDNCKQGVNSEIASRLGIQKTSILAPKKNQLSKLVYFCPSENVTQVSKAIFDVGGGKIGNYKECSFETEGKGCFLPTNGAHPAIGNVGNRECINEKRVEILISNHKIGPIISALKSVHPYEEVAYEIYPITNFNQDEGAGMIGKLAHPIATIDFLKRIKTTFNCGIIRHTKILKNTIETVAFCGGSGSFLLPMAKAKKADIFITADYKYHDFFDAEDQIIIADIGHYESEQFTPNLIYRILTENFINFAPYLSTVNTNPINYF